MQKLKGLWIPVEILLNKDLSDKEKIILSMILYLSEETKSCFASNKYIASIVNVTANRVSKIISSLKDKEYIKVKLKYKTDSKEIEQRQITPIVQNINRYNSKSQEGIETNNYLNSQKQQYPIYNKDKDIRKSYNKIKKEDFLFTDVEHKEQGRVIINNIKNKNNYNKWDTCKKENNPYRSDRNYDDFDWNSLYANLKEVNSTYIQSTNFSASFSSILI